MSEIGNRAKSIFEERYQQIRKERELREKQKGKYANLILDIFKVSNEIEDSMCRVWKIRVMYDEDSQKLKCSVVVYDEAKTIADATNYSDSVANKKVQEAIRIVNLCHATKTTLMDIRDFLANDSQVIKYFNICIDLENSFIIEMRDENEEAICEKEKPK